MGFPESAAFDDAIQNLSSTMADPELRDGEVGRNRLGLPLRWTGNFAKVYRVDCPRTSNNWAVKCFTREVRDRQVRYPRIAAHLGRARLPFLVDFEYLEKGIRVEGIWHPIVKMRWVEGSPLHQFVEDHLDRPEMLRQLLRLWPRLSRMLREAGVAHADLQHGNVLLAPHEGGQLALRLVDYDGMYVPGLEGTDSGERGHPAYQHPQRINEGTYNAEVDRFSHLLIYTAVRCLTSGHKALWQDPKFNNGENLLFRRSDLERPGQSELFQRLWASPDLEVRDLVGRLALARYYPLEQTPLLDEILSDGDGTVQPLDWAEESTAHVLLAAGQAAVVVGGGATEPAPESPAPEPASSDDAARRNPQDSSARQQADAAQARARESADAMGDVGPETSVRRFEPTEELKALYRQEAKELVEIGKQCHEKKEYDQAIAYFTEAIRLDSSYAGANRKLRTRTATAATPTKPKKSSIRPLPTTARPSGSIRSTRAPMKTVAMLTKRRVTMTEPSPTTLRPSGSIRVTSVHISVAPVPTKIWPTTIRPSPTIRRLLG